MTLYLTKERCHAIFTYRNGLLVNKLTRNSKSMAGGEAGSTCSCGYRRLSIDGIRYLVHRVVFLMHHGYMPEVVDHINGDKLDNQIANLRAATRNENSRNRKLNTNNKSGIKGVSWRKDISKWSCSISYEGTQHHLGFFADIELAELVVQGAREYLHGEYANHG